MKVFIICSKSFYDFILPIKARLEHAGYKVILPNCFDNPNSEAEMHKLGEIAHSKFKADMYKKSEDTIKECDMVLVLNFEKNNIPNYIGGATFLEMYDAFRLGKKIYMYNQIPNSIMTDEIKGFSPTVISGDLSKLYYSNYMNILLFFELRPNGLTLEQWMKEVGYTGDPKEFARSYNLDYYTYFQRQHLIVNRETGVVTLGENGQQYIDAYRRKFTEPIQYNACQKRLTKAEYSE